MWKIVRERAILLHGPAAAVMQVAHPKVAAGVRDHSNFQSGAMRRLHRTLDAVYAIAFGTDAQARAAADAVGRLHARVRGRVDPVDPASSYLADDPELLMWVVATLVMSSVNGYERAVGPLSEAEKQAFYRDMRRFGTFFRLREEYGPQTWEQFLDYWQGMLNDPALGSSEVSRSVARHVARPRRPRWLWLSSAMIGFIFSEILPSPVRERLGYRSTHWSRLCMQWTDRLMPALLPWVPGALRYVAEYRVARRRRLYDAQRAAA